jgi:predicted nucleotidyltransferase
MTRPIKYRERDMPNVSRHRSQAVDIDSLVEDKRAEIGRIAKSNGATRVWVFGSFARGTASPESDFDLFIDLEPGRHLFDVVAIKQDLEDLLHRQVHVVTESSLSPYIRAKVLRDATPL